MGYRSTYNRRLRAAKRLRKRLAVGVLLGVSACAAAVLGLREVQPMGAAAYVQADAAAPMRLTARSLAALSAPAAHPVARRVYPYSIVPGGVSGRAEVVHVLQTDQVVAQHYAGLQVARLGTVTVSKPRAVYVSYRKGDKVYWTSQKMVLAQGETLLTDGSNEIRGRCGNRISDQPRLPVEANGPTVAMLDAAMDLDADETDTGDQREAGLSPLDAGTGGASAGAQPSLLAASTYGSGGASPYARPPSALSLLAMSGLSGGAAPIRQSAPQGAPTMLSTQTSVASDSSVSSGTPGTPGAPADGTSGPGTETGSGDTGTGSTGSTPGTNPDGGTAGGTATPATSTIKPDPASETTDGDTKAGLPPSNEPLTQTDTPPVIGKAPVQVTQVPEPGSLSLSGIALAAILLLRRKRRR